MRVYSYSCIFEHTTRNYTHALRLEPTRFDAVRNVPYNHRLSRDSAFHPCHNSRRFALSLQAVTSTRTPNRDVILWMWTWTGITARRDSMRGKKREDACTFAELWSKMNYLSAGILRQAVKVGQEADLSIDCSIFLLFLLLTYRS